MSKKFTLLGVAAAAAMLAVAVPSTSAAQTQKSGQVTRGNVISALNNIDAQINKLNALNHLTVSQVRVVNVQDLFNKNNVNALNQALNNNHTKILNLRNVLNNNEVIKNALNSNNVALDRVVAVNVLSGGGGVTVFQQ
jgi:galactokinase